MAGVAHFANSLIHVLAKSALRLRGELDTPAKGEGYAEQVSDMSKKTWMYSTLLKKLEAEHLGRMALLHNGKVVAIYNDSGDAYAIGREKYGLGNFSTQTIGEKPIHPGIFTFCLPK